MILRFISVASWRCFLETVNIGPFTDGLNIVHAPNGTGKSTLFEAMRCALLSGHRVSGKSVDDLRPWGRELAPKVTVEFVHRGTEYRITKQFQSSQSALLERKENGRFQPLAEGVHADEQTRALLTQNPSGRGLGRVENWGFGQILWAPQGNLVLPSLSEDLVTNIHAMLNAQVSGPGTDPIERKIEERYLEFYTPTGKPKAGLDRLEQELKDARAALRETQGLYQDFDDVSRRVERLRAQREQSRRDVREIVKALEEARRSAAINRALLTEKDHYSEQAKTAEAQYNQLKQRIDHIRQTEDDLIKGRSTVATIEAAIPLNGREVLERAKEAEKTKAALEDARKGRKNVDDAERLAEDARQYTEKVTAQAGLDTLIEQIRTTQEQLAERKQQRSELVAPDTEVLRALRKAIKERDDAQVRLDASLITLEVSPEQDGQLDIVAGERTGPMTLSAGVPVRIQGSPEVVVVIPGIARLRASGPTGSTEEYRAERAQAEQKIRELTAPYGSQDLNVLDALMEKATLVEAAISEAETRLETLLSGRTVESFVQERNIFETMLAGILETYPDWMRLPPDSQALKSKAGDVKRFFNDLVEETEDKRDQAQSALAAVTGQQEALTRQLTDARARVVALQTKLTEVTNDGKQARDHETELGQFAIAWDAAKARLTEIDNKLELRQGDSDAAVEKLEQQLEAAKQAESQAREQELREETRLEGISARGPYSLLALAEEKASRLEEDARSKQLRKEAIRLLRNTVAQCRTEVIAAIARPVETAATRIFQRIASRRIGRIHIGEVLQPAGVIPEALGKPVEIDNISGGEQEQLYLATRLALADVLTRDERQLVVLDDVLTSTDAGRLARVMIILEEAAQRLQILVLTCHPERYRGLKEASFFDLEAVLQASVLAK